MYLLLICNNKLFLQVCLLTPLMNYMSHALTCLQSLNIINNSNIIRTLKDYLVMRCICFLAFTLLKMIFHLTQEQAKILEVAKLGHNIFFTGEAGTGKSYLIGAIVDWLRKSNKTFTVMCLSG